jgi:hypothetical protein
MGERKLYRRRTDQAVIAVQLRLDTMGFSYHKWNAEQQCKAGDWIVDNDGDVYTVDADSFTATYCSIGLGTYIKVTPVWAERVDSPGCISTKEGQTYYEKGDYLVSNNKDGTDSYAINAKKFESMYETAK